MSDVKQILVVDDHFEMLEFLRSMLEFSSQDYQVLGVPSAEEGFLELRRTPFDLLITDVRLPGMSGFDLVRKVKSVRPDVPVIMITGYTSEQGMQEASDLDVVRYFKKPLDTDSLLAAVSEALYGVQEVLKPAPDENSSDAVPTEVRKRLATLRTDTGAEQVTLISASGEVQFSVGQDPVDLPKLAKSITTSMKSTLAVAAQLGSDDPMTIQYQAGQLYDLYSANVGRSHSIAIFFDAQSRRGRIGTIWVFAQRAISDLLTLLPTTSSTVELAAGKPTASPEVESTTPKSDLTTGPIAAPTQSQAQPAAEEETDTLPDPLSLEEMRELLGVELPADANDVDLDSYWADVLDEELDKEQPREGLSLDQARREGLVPTDFDSDS